MLEAYKNALEAGDLIYAALSAQNYCYHSFFCGTNLEEVESELAKYGRAIEQMKQDLTLNTNRIYRQVVANLLGKSDQPTELIGEFYNEEKMVPRHFERGEKLLLFDVFLNKLI